MLLGLSLLFRELDGLDHETVPGAAGILSRAELNGAVLLLFIGATGKSAQILIFTWLPDAIAGPTPVSALIYAAAMVTGGLYLLARLPNWCWRRPLPSPRPFRSSWILKSFSDPFKGIFRFPKAYCCYTVSPQETTLDSPNQHNPMNRWLPILLGFFLTLFWNPGQVAGQTQPGSGSAQDFFPRQGFMLSGYGGAGYNIIMADSLQPNNFSAIFAPIMLFQISDRFLFEGELEFEIEEDVTATNLEYAQVDIGISNNLTLVAGKFLLPFATFSERTHPTWINRLPSVPALYGSHGNVATPTDPLLPILSDIGVQLRGAFSMGAFSTLTAELFLTQGPMVAGEEGGDAHSDEAGIAAKAAGVLSGGAEPGGLAFGGNVSDNNENKMIGGRIGFGVAPYFEANLSGMTAAYDPEGELTFSALGLHLEGRYSRLTLHSEFIQTWQDLAEEEMPVDEAAKRGDALGPLNEAAHETLSRNGFWVLLGYRSGKWQPVVRWSQLFKGELDGETVVEPGRQLALGLDYWFEPSLVVKAEYLINDEDHAIDNNRLAIQLAFGF